MQLRAAKLTDMPCTSMAVPPKCPLAAHPRTPQSCCAAPTTIRWSLLRCLGPYILRHLRCEAAYTSPFNFL